MGLYLDKTNKYLLGLRMVALSNAIVSLIGFAALPTGMISWNSLFAITIGSVMSPIIPAGIGFCTMVVGSEILP